MRQFLLPLLGVCILIGIGYLLNRYIWEEGVFLLRTLFREHKVLTAFFILIAVLLSTVFLIPSFMFLTCSAGFLYGWPIATAIVSLGSIIGAIIAFSAARSSSWRPKIHAWIGKKAPLHRFEDLLNRSNWEAILLIRLFPMFPNRVLHYVFGLIDLPLRRFLFPTWLGTIPIILIYSYLGSQLRTLASIHQISGSALFHAFYFFAGFLVMIGSLFFLRFKRT